MAVCHTCQGIADKTRLFNQLKRFVCGGSHEFLPPEEGRPSLREITVRDLLRVHPLIRSRQLDRHIRNKDVQGLAIGEAAMLG
jgi:hypothetical protein